MGACVASVQSDHIDVVGVAGGDLLSQQGAPVGDDERIGGSSFLKQCAEGSQSLMQGVFRKLAREVLRLCLYLDYFTRF